MCPSIVILHHSQPLQRRRRLPRLTDPALAPSGRVGSGTRAGGSTSPRFPTMAEGASRARITRCEADLLARRRRASVGRAGGQSGRGAANGRGQKPRAVRTKVIAIGGFQSEIAIVRPKDDDAGSSRATSHTRILQHTRRADDVSLCSRLLPVWSFPLPPRNTHHAMTASPIVNVSIASSMQQ